MNRLLSVFIFLILLVSAVSAKPLKIVYAIPRAEQDMFFGPSVGFMRVCAKSLGVSLELIESKGNHLITAKQIDSALSQKDRPDAVIALSAKENGREIIRVCQNRGVPLFIENAAILDSTIGLPRKKYSKYIGEMIPDDFQAGYLLAKKLISQGKPGSNGKIQIAAVNGPYGNGPASQREAGLRKAVKESKNAELKQVVYAEWDPGTAKEMVRGLLKRYPEISVIWAASDGMALGAAEAAKEINRRQGRDFTAGGVDWSTEGVEALRNGTLSATAGGQFMEAAWALIVVHDYLKGYDFSKQGVKMKTGMVLMTSQNQKEYSKLLVSENWKKVPFRSFSKAYNKSLVKYDFSIRKVLSLINQ